MQYCSTSDFWDTQYSLLGDDVVIHDEKLAKAYLKFMREIGVDINKQKSVISDNILEFAKRHFLNQVEVSGISMKRINSIHKN